MDISSIALDSEKETYIGRGTGVNEGKTFFLSVVLRREDSIAGMGLGALATWTRELVGKVLTWKNQPVYDELWKIIEDDCLAMCRDKEPQLVAAETWFEPSRPEPYSFASSDGKCDGMVAGYRGGNIDWLTTCKFFSKQLGFGESLMRPSAVSQAPLLGVFMLQGVCALTAGSTGQRVRRIWRYT